MAGIAGTCPLGALLRNSVSENNGKISVVHYEGLRLQQRMQMPSPSQYISASSCKSHYSFLLILVLLLLNYERKTLMTCKGMFVYIENVIVVV